MEKKQHVRIILKNGVDFVTECDRCIAKANGYGQLTEIRYEGVSKNFPMFVDIKEIAAIIQLEVHQ